MADTSTGSGAGAMPVALASTSSQYDFWPYWTGPCSRTVGMGLLPDSTALGGNRGDRRR
jgi:hypothetical protein